MPNLSARCLFFSSSETPSIGAETGAAERVDATIDADAVAVVAILGGDFGAAAVGDAAGISTLLMAAFLGGLEGAFAFGEAESAAALIGAEAVVVVAGVSWAAAAASSNLASNSSFFPAVDNPRAVSSEYGK